LIAYNTIKEAGILVKNGKFKSITTLPVTKESINLIDKDFYGHTEFYQKLWDEKKVFMTFVSEKMNLLLLTTHIPLKDVSSHLNKELLESGINIALEMRDRLGLSKKICLLGLNPHAGENGLLGDEEFVFKEVLKKFDSSKIEGPIPSDTAFIPYNLNKYSIFIAVYHDQGLIPFKMVAFDDGVNLSFGMKYIRTSVDHGTGIGLIGKKSANTKSFENAYNLAFKLTN
ncbi:MAG TPA: 4-hydroxythreonine-4-phosphate dehydrogenase PdxA, partial [Spirochaetota bacterium]|nr:4-hydroxythreonine-4-phosphate dehydrogenase PdxA [Spirochaetota bacterium]